MTVTELPAIERLVRKRVRAMPDYPAPAIVDAECKLNQNESPYDLPAPIKQQIAERIRAAPLNRYYDGTSEALRKKLARRFSVRPENVLVGCGIDELLYYLVLAFVEKGEKVLRPIPSFSMYPICASVAGARDVAIPLDANFELTEEFVRESQDAKITFICRPNNPTGNSFDKKTIGQIAKKTKGIVCIDEAYAEFAAEDCLDLLKYPNVVVMRTFSKMYSGAAVRLGYALADKAIIRCMGKVRLPWNVSLISQAIGEIILDNAAYFEAKRMEIVGERKRMENAMRQIPGVRVYPSDANFMLFRPLRNASRVWESLLQKGILIRKMEKSGLAGFLRVNAGKREENDRFLAALRAVAAIDAVLFDIDGVLVDVSRSYRLAIQKTAEKFLDRKVLPEEVDAIKSIAGFNNDWDATYALVTGIRGQNQVRRNGKQYAAIRSEFQNLYLGTYMRNEKVLIDKATLSGLQRLGLPLGIVTSRPRSEALYALRSFIPRFLSERAIVALEDCLEEKPSPKPLLLASERLDAQCAIYVGDSINDQQAAEAAGMPFVSVTPGLQTDFYMRDVNQILEVISNAGKN